MWLIIVCLLIVNGFCQAQDYLGNNNYNPPWQSGSSNNVNNYNSFWDNNVIVNEASYFVVAGRTVRPSQIYRVVATVYTMKHPVTVRASIQNNGVEVATDAKSVKKGINEVLLMKIPPTSSSGHYKLKVEGLYDGVLGEVAFVNETSLIFSNRSMTIFVQTDKPIYKQGETVNFRAIPITTELRAFDGIIDVFMLDPKKRILKRWLSRQSNLGTVSLNYQLSDQPVFGEWCIQVHAQGQIEENTFVVEEYYQTRFEVNVTMNPFVFTNDEFLEGTVMANYTGGAPVRGNLTLKATIRPFRSSNIYIDNFPLISEEDFYFEESFPFWFPQQKHDELKKIPHLTWFEGVYHFKYPAQELIRKIQGRDDLELMITARVGERFLDEIIEGYSIARFSNASVKVFFLGASPQVFKPTSPYTLYLGVSFHDGSPLPKHRVAEGRIEINSEVAMKTSGRQTVYLNVSQPNNGIWTIQVDLRNQMGLREPWRANDILKDVDYIRINAAFRDINGDRSYTEFILMSYYSPTDHFIKVSTSTEEAKVGEYIVFHVQSNFNMESFNYIISSKGNIIVASQEYISSGIYTFSVALSAEMSPSATILVYHVGRFGDILADSLTFPVNGISRNNFTVFINNKKARTGEIVEVVIYGEPGAYVGLSGIDRPLYNLQLGNELSYARVLQKMDRYDHGGNSSLLHAWLSHSGDPDDLIHLPSYSYGIDANQTFDFAGMVVFTDIVIPKKHDWRNQSYNYYDGNTVHFFNATELALFRRNRFNKIQRHYENVWLWKDINIGPHGRFIFKIPVPHRPAHWMITAFSMSQSFGFGMLQKPIEYMGILPFFINVEMPTKSRQGEQVGIRVTVFNYMKSAIEAVVLLEGSESYKFVHVEAEGIVSSYNPKTTFGEHQFFVYIKPQDAAIVYLPIVPVKLGDIEVSVRATTLIATDNVTRILHVEADGVPQYRHQAILLDLTNRATVLQYMHVNVTETPILPYALDRYYIYGSNRASISVCGDVVGPIFPTMPVNATSLLNLPMDGAEQTMFGFTAMMYTTMYMRLINLRNRTQEKWSFHYMNIQYQRMLSFMNEDGSFSLFRSDWNLAPKSVWLTSYCIRMFQEARFYEWENYLFIDPEVISRALAWLLKHQTENGAFYEVTWIPDRKVNISSSNVTYDNQHRNITLTAHVLITLASVKDVGSLGGMVSTAALKAMRWIEQNIQLLNDHGDPYEIAVVAYALMLCQSSSANYVYGLLNSRGRSDGGYLYWSRSYLDLPPTKLENQKPYSLPRLPYKYDSMNIEATAYALLVYVPRQEDEKTESIVRWLNAQRLLDAGWASTQDTAVAMKALIEYTIRDRQKDVFGLSINVDATALAGTPKSIHVNRKNMANLQKFDIPHAWGTVKVSAKGTGYALLQMSVQYNVDIARFQTQPPVPAFALVPKAHFYGRNQSHITYLSCQKWIYTNESPRSGMAVLDVTIPTGYIVQQQKLDAYVRNQEVRNLLRARFLEQKVVFYFEYLDDTETCVRFTVERWMPVANMSRYLPIRVYDYYAPERFNETIFDALPTYLLNICEVCGSSQCPYCRIYNAAVKISITVYFSVILSLLLIFL